MRNTGDSNAGKVGKVKKDGKKRAITAVGAASLLAMVGMIAAVAAFRRRRDYTSLEGTSTPGQELAMPMMKKSLRGKVEGYMLPDVQRHGNLIMGR